MINSDNRNQMQRRLHAKTSSLMILVAFTTACAREEGASPTGAIATPVQVAAFEARHGQDTAKNLPGVRLTLSAAGGKNVFHMGETIPLNLAFSCSIRNNYRLELARTGRMPVGGSDTIYSAPAIGATDPLRDYDDLNPTTVTGGNIMEATPPLLQEKPQSVTVYLNEWLRFDRPGTYRVYIVSNRVCTEHPVNAADSGRRTMTSNIFRYDILPPDPHWSATTLQEAIHNLSSPKEDERIAGGQNLVDLYTREAAVELIRRQVHEGPGNLDFVNYTAGLYASPFRSFIIREMERCIEDPDAAITSSFLKELSDLKFLSLPIPLPGPRPEKNVTKDALWRVASQLRESTRAAIAKEYRNRVLAAVPMKRGQAKPVTLQTLAEGVGA